MFLDDLTLKGSTMLRICATIVTINWEGTKRPPNVLIKTDRIMPKESDKIAT